MLSSPSRTDSPPSSGRATSLLFSASSSASAVAILTPCVLPMIRFFRNHRRPGQERHTGRAFTLALTYVLGMSLTYTIAGALRARGQTGADHLPTAVDPGVVRGSVRRPRAVDVRPVHDSDAGSIQTRVANVSNNQAAGTFGGVAVMGVLSALIVTACVDRRSSAPWSVIGQTGQIARGAAALYAMGLGMGTPLLIVGASAGKLLPKAGAWMDTVKKLFGVMLLAVAVWMLATASCPERFGMVLWAALAVIAATGYSRSNARRRPGAGGLRASRPVARRLRHHSLIGVAARQHRSAAAARNLVPATTPAPSEAEPRSPSTRSSRSMI